MATPATAPGDGNAYTIRRYEPGDEEGVVSLRETVWGQSLSAEWLRWKYAENPYLDHVAMFVAETDGEIVGTRPFVPFRMGLGDTTSLALLATDTMVHPDHRRRGLFTRMTERAVDHYRRAEPAFVFNFPNEKSLPGYEKLGWRAVHTRRTDYRVQNPAAFLRAGGDGRLRRIVGRVATPMARSYLRLRERVGPAARGVSVERHDGVPVARLTSLYEGAVPAALHAVRDEAFYRWRFDSPRWESPTSYLAAVDGRPVAGVVTQTRTNRRGVRRTALVDVLPLAGDGRRTEVASALLRRVVEDHRESDVLVAPGGVLPDDALATAGFVGDHTPPLSMIAGRRFELAVRSLAEDDSWRMAGHSLTDPATWRLSLAERPYY